MKKQPIFKSHLYVPYILWIGLAFFSFFTVFVSKGAIKGGHLQLFPILFGSFFAFFVLSCLWVILFYENYYELFDDKLVVYSSVRYPIKTIMLDDVTEYENMDGNIQTFNVFAKNKHYSFYSSDEHFDDVRKYILDNCANCTPRRLPDAEPTSKNKWVEQIPYLIILGVGLVVSSWFIFSGLRSWLTPNHAFENLALHELKGTVISRPEIHNKSKDHYVYIHLKEFPSNTFFISGTGFDAADLNRISTISVGDSLSVMIKEDDFQKYISKTKSMGFWDKVDYSTNLYLYSLTGKTEKYLTVEGYKYTNASQGGFGLFMAILGLGLMIWTFVGYNKQRIKASSSG